MSKPIAILVSDTHYSLKTLDIADLAWRKAVDKAAELDVPLIDCGDLTNDKAILRGEVMNRLIETMLYAEESRVPVYLLVGNHSLINEKGTEHVLNFLKPYALVVSMPTSYMGFNFIPYQSDASKFMEAIQKFPKGSTVIAHQGTIGGQLGDYIKDSSAIDPNDITDWKVYLGHYHAHYTLKNTVSIGNPYTLSFGEASDGLKGFLILNSDGTFTREILHLRSHIKLEMSIKELELYDIRWANSTVDLVWLKVSGPQSELLKLDKKAIGERLLGHSNYKLDLIPTDSQAKVVIQDKIQTPIEVFKSLINDMAETDKQKTYLKELTNEVT